MQQARQQHDDERGEELLMLYVVAGRAGGEDLPSARFLTVWHSIAQIHRHYGEPAAAELLALSQAKGSSSTRTNRPPSTASAATTATRH